MGLIYDKLARVKWSQRATSNEPDFDVNSECIKASARMLCAHMSVRVGREAELDLYLID